MQIVELSTICIYDRLNVHKMTYNVLDQYYKFDHFHMILMIYICLCLFVAFFIKNLLFVTCNFPYPTPA